MKTLITTITLLFSALSLTMAQNTIIVDNNPNPISNITTFSAGLTAAANGDIIMLIPSATSYGDLTITKEVTVAGGGANGNAGQFTEVGTVTVNANNVTVGGMRMTSITALSDNDLTVSASFIVEEANFDNVTNLGFNYNRARNVVIASCDSVVMFKNYINVDTESITTNGILEIESSNNVVIGNSVIRANSSQTFVSVDNASSAIIFNNNVFDQDAYRSRMDFEFGSNSIMTNNIFEANHDGFTFLMVVNGGSSYQHNLFTNIHGATTGITGTGITFELDYDGAGGGVGTQEDENGNNFHVHYARTAVHAGSTFYQLATNSPAEDAGTGSDRSSPSDEADLGIYGGLDPMPSEGPHEAIGVSVVPSVTAIRLSLPSAATGGNIILNATGKAAQN